MGAGSAPLFGVPERASASRPFSSTIRLNTSLTERTPWPGFQSYLPAITRARPVNFLESVPASSPKAAWIFVGCTFYQVAMERQTIAAQLETQLRNLFPGCAGRHYLLSAACQFTATVRGVPNC